MGYKVQKLTSRDLANKDSEQRRRKKTNSKRSRSIVGKRSWLTKKRMERTLRQIFNLKIMKGGILWLN